MGYHLWGHIESDMTERLTLSLFHFVQWCTTNCSIKAESNKESQISIAQPSGSVYFAGVQCGSAGAGGGMGVQWGLRSIHSFRDTDSFHGVASLPPPPQGVLEAPIRACALVFTTR